jgi:hypothetical protein
MTPKNAEGVFVCAASDGNLCCCLCRPLVNYTLLIQAQPVARCHVYTCSQWVEDVMGAKGAWQCLCWQQQAGQQQEEWRRAEEGAGRCQLYGGI